MGCKLRLRVRVCHDVSLATPRRQCVSALRFGIPPGASTLTPRLQAIGGSEPRLKTARPRQRNCTPP
eukprot:7986721-Pyramimonas_sp.AAC.1